MASTYVNNTLLCGDATLARMVRNFVVSGFRREELRPGPSGLDLPCINTACMDADVWASVWASYPGSLPDILEWPWASIVTILLVALAAAGMPTHHRLQAAGCHRTCRLRLVVLLTTALVGMSWLTREPMVYEPSRGSITQLHIFWHIASLTEVHRARSDAIVRRQLRLLNGSGLLERATLHLGLVGPVWARPAAVLELLASRRPGIRVRVAARSRLGHECVTTRALHEFATSVPSALPVRVLYMHSRGTTRGFVNPHDVAAHAWTRMLEHVTIERWRDAVSALDTPSRAHTAGPELCPGGMVRRCRYQDETSVWHYRGNFWWATSEWLRRLPRPVAIDRYVCGESWVVGALPFNRSRHVGLHCTAEPCCSNNAYGSALHLRSQMGDGGGAPGHRHRQPETASQSRSGRE